MSDNQQLREGERVPGTKYRVIRLIGFGGMGSVYEVEHEELGKRFVLKTLLSELSTRADLVQRLRTEWRALGRLEHPNIVRVSDAGVAGEKLPYFVMERLTGETLAARLAARQRLHIDEALSIAIAVLDALAVAHGIGIIHRDVKPPNIFVTADGVPKLLDFGIAKLLDASAESITARGVAVGTPRYMSPEQASGDPVDARADLYAVGLVLYEMISGVGPYRAADHNELFLAHLAQTAPPLSSHLAGISLQLDAVVAALLAKSPAQRPPSAVAARDALRAVAELQRAMPRTPLAVRTGSASAAKVSHAAPVLHTVAETQLPTVVRDVKRVFEVSTPAFSPSSVGPTQRVSAVPAAEPPTKRDGIARQSEPARSARRSSQGAAALDPSNTLRLDDEEGSQHGAALGPTQTSAPVADLGTPPPVSRALGSAHVFQRWAQGLRRWLFPAAVVAAAAIAALLTRPRAERPSSEPPSAEQSRAKQPPAEQPPAEQPPAGQQSPASPAAAHEPLQQDREVQAVMSPPKTGLPPRPSVSSSAPAPSAPPPVGLARATTLDQQRPVTAPSALPATPKPAQPTKKMPLPALDTPGFDSPAKPAPAGNRSAAAGSPGSKAGALPPSGL